MLSVALVALVSLGAPYQCAGEPDFEERREETPGEALFGLAQQFRARGDLAAWRETLEYLVARYPNSRFAAMARSDLAAAREGSAGERERSNSPPEASGSASASQEAEAAAP